MTPDDRAASRIIAAGPGDAEALAAMHGRLLEPPWDAAAMSALLVAPTTVALLALGAVELGTGDTAQLGFLLARIVADEAEILSIGVVREAQAQGVGRSLVGALLERCRSVGVAHLYLEVAERNGAARALYARTGFHEAGRRAGYYARAGARAEDALILRLTF